MVITVMLFAVVWTSRLSIDIDKDPSTGDYGFVRPPVPTSKFVDSIEIFPDVSNSCSRAHRWLGLNRDETLIELTQTVTSLRSRTLVIWWNGYVYETLKLLALTASGRKFQSFPFLQDYVLGPVRMPVRALLTQSQPFLEWSIGSLIKIQTLPEKVPLWVFCGVLDMIGGIHLHGVWGAR